MVGINVGGRYSGLEVGSIVAVAVWLGKGVAVTLVWLGIGVIVAAEVAIGDVVTIDCPHATNMKQIIRRTSDLKRLFMLSHSLLLTWLFQQYKCPSR
jgi:hypothetical protein